MDEVKKAIHLVMQELRKEFGEEAQLEEGDDVVTVFNNCVLILSMHQGEIGVQFVGGKPLRVDAALSFYKETE